MMKKIFEIEFDGNSDPYIGKVQLEACIESFFDTTTVKVREIDLQKIINEIADKWYQEAQEIGDEWHDGNEWTSFEMYGQYIKLLDCKSELLEKIKELMKTIGE